jgi:flagellar biosynthesis protein FliP
VFVLCLCVMLRTDHVCYLTKVQPVMDKRVTSNKSCNCRLKLSSYQKLLQNFILKTPLHKKSTIIYHLQNQQQQLTAVTRQRTATLLQKH